MTDRPLIFSAPMICALLAGRKSQTRRLVKPRFAEAMDFAGEDLIRRFPHQEGSGYEVGDRLWVRETWAPLDACTHNDAGPQAHADRGFYRADNSTNEGEISRWRSSIHMPRWASRLTLLVTDVRVQRLQAISDEDARAEGIFWSDDHLGWTSGRIDEASDYHARLPGVSFSKLWDAIHGPDVWDANPWVVALTFSVERRNIDAEETTHD